jgi:DNA adenine methylase
MRGPLSYIGGKNRLANKIIAILPEHVTYVEAFAGGCQVLFRKDPSKVEVINDLSEDIVNFFRVCQSHHEELVRYLSFTVVSRSWFNLLAKQDPISLTDVQRAARFFYLQKNCFGGLVVNRHYHYSVVEQANFNPATFPKLLRETHDRLSRVQIESLPYEEIIKKYDRPTTFFYLDPPYWGRSLYAFNLSNEDFVTMRDRLRCIQGKFLLSINDVPEIREIFKEFTIQELRLAYSAQPKAGNTYPELLIRNYPLPSKEA